MVDISNEVRGGPPASNTLTEIVNDVGFLTTAINDADAGFASHASNAASNAATATVATVRAEALAEACFGAITPAIELAHR